MTGNRQQIAIVGGGLAGSLLSIYFAKRGYEVDIYERRPDMRRVDIPAGRSINLALSTRGIHALKEVGAFEEIQKILIPMKGRMIHALDKSLTFQPYSQNEHEYINSVSRRDLNVTLMNLAEKTGKATFHFHQRCLEYHFESKKLRIRDEQSGDETTIEASLVIGADGSASAIRQSIAERSGMQVKEEQLDYKYKELTIPPSYLGDFRLKKNALHIWPRKSFMLIALPNQDKSFTCTLFLPATGKLGFELLKTEDDIRAFFSQEFPDAVPEMPTLIEDFFENPTSSLATVRTPSWHIDGDALLLGDAAHAMVPFFGQGMNCAFEDCTVLNECMEKYNNDWTKTFSEFETLRKENATAIQDMALENFVEMRDSTADAAFHRKKELERLLEKEFPDTFTPRYSMVTFRRLPYAEAKRRGDFQEKILSGLVGLNDDTAIQRAKPLIDELLNCK